MSPATRVPPEFPREKLTFGISIAPIMQPNATARKNGKNPNSSSYVRFAFGSGITTEFAATNDSLSFAMSIFKIFGTI